MPSLKPNHVKRVERFPKPTNTAAALQPMFEAISNAIHSTQSKFGEDVAGAGKVSVSVITGRRQAPVTITIEDNGVGLDDKNFEAFATTDTDNKIAIGGKGVGRLLWLDAFESIKVQSIYRQNGNSRRRSFRFVLSNSEQIQEYTDEDLPNYTGDTSFLVKFYGLRDNGYRAKFPGRPSYVFQHLTSHFLPSFIGKRCPKISVTCGDDMRTYPDAINSIVHRRETLEDLETEEFGALSFTLMECDKVASSDLQGTHFVHFIAHDRTVHSQKIDGKLGLKYFGSDEDRVFHGILTGEFFDKNVNQERTAFLFEDSVFDKIINDVCFNHIANFLEAPLAMLRTDQRQKIEAITQSYPSVAFGDVDELQSRVPSGELNDDAIYGHLARERFRRDQRQADKIRGVLSRLKDGAANLNSFISAIEEAGKAIEDAEQKSLAEYVIRRKVVLAVLIRAPEESG